MRPPEKLLSARRGAAVGRYVFKFTALCLLFLIASCDTTTDPYSTTVNDRQAVTKLYSGRARMCIVSFTASPKVSRQGTGGPLQALRDRAVDYSKLDSEITAGLVVADYRAFKSAFNEKFEVVGTADPAVQTDLASALSPDQISARLKAVKADYAIAVRDQYGWNEGDSIILNGVEKFNIRTCTTIFKANGQAVWAFCSRGFIEEPEAATPSPSSAPPKSDALTGASAEDMFKKFFELYPRFLLLLIKEDAAGVAHKGEGTSFNDYVNKSFKETGLFIVNDKSPSYSHIYRDLD
jgi:hypothetical protein